MSMALFLRAVTPAEAEVMLKDASMVDEIVEREGDDVLATDLQDSWDILRKLLRGGGFKGARSLGECLSNGGELLTAEQVKIHAQLLAAYTPEYVGRLFDELDEGLQALAAERQWQRRVVAGRNQRIAVRRNAPRSPDQPELPFLPRRIGR